MRLVVMFCVALCIAACGEKAQTNDQQTAPAGTVAQSRSAAELLAAFRTEISVCVSAMQTFERDRAFLEAFMDASKRESRPLEDFLRQAAFAKSGDIQYILSNLKYFVIDVSFHPTGFAVAWVRNEPVYCAVGMKRLEEIEALGESPEAWEVREYFLERWLKDLRPPSDEADFFPEQYEGFNKFVTAASKLYSANFRPQLHAWGKTAIEHLESQRGGLQEGAGGQTLAQQNAILDSEEAFLRTLLQLPPHEYGGGGTRLQAGSAPAAARADPESSEPVPAGAAVR